RGSVRFDRRAASDRPAGASAAHAAVEDAVDQPQRDVRPTQPLTTSERPEAEAARREADREAAAREAPASQAALPEDPRQRQHAPAVDLRAEAVGRRGPALPFDEREDLPEELQIALVGEQRAQPLDREALLADAHEQGDVEDP